MLFNYISFQVTNPKFLTFYPLDDCLNNQFLLIPPNMNKTYGALINWDFPMLYNVISIILSPRIGWISDLKRFAFKLVFLLTVLKYIFQIPYTHVRYITLHGQQMMTCRSTLKTDMTLSETSIFMKSTRRHSGVNASQSKGPFVVNCF